MQIQDYFEVARDHEGVFRNILRRLPKDTGGRVRLNPEAPLEDIFEEHSQGDRYGKFTILDFRVGPYDHPFGMISENEAFFSMEDIACMSGWGRDVKYKINPDNSVEFDSNLTTWRS